MIRASLGEGVWTLSLDRPDKRNAMTPAMLRALLDHLVAPPRGARCLLLRGEGACFCSGFDLEACRDDPEGVLGDLLRLLAQVIGVLRSLPMGVVVGVHAAAIAGGCALLGGADVVVADRGAKLGYPAVRLGISPAVSAATLRVGVGDGAARALLLDPGVVTAERAAAMGLVDLLANEAADVVALATQAAGTLAAKPPHAVQSTRAWIREVEGVSPDSSQAALGASLSLVGGPECRDRLARFWEGARP